MALIHVFDRLKSKKAGIEKFKRFIRYDEDNGGSSKCFEGKFAVNSLLILTI